jgi:hypothetical protein
VLDGAVTGATSLYSFASKISRSRGDMGQRRGVWLLELLPLIGRALMLRWRVLGRWLGVESGEGGVREWSAILHKILVGYPLLGSNRKRQTSL